MSDNLKVEGTNLYRQAPEEEISIVQSIMDKLPRYFVGIYNSDSKFLRINLKIEWVARLWDENTIPRPVELDKEFIHLVGRMLLYRAAKRIKELAKELPPVPEKDAKVLEPLWMKQDIEIRSFLGW